MIRSPHFPIDGGCSCGAVRYRLLENSLGLHACHCTNCQTVTGSAFLMCMPIRRQSLELLAGDPKVVVFTTTDGLEKRNRRCKECDCMLWGEIDKMPEIFALQPGTLDDTSWLEPIAHIWTRSAQPWVKIPSGVLVYEERPDDLELVRAWKSRSDA